MRSLKAWDVSNSLMSDIRGYVDNESTIKVFNKDGGITSYPKSKIFILHGSGFNDKNGVEIFEGDLHYESFSDDGFVQESYLPVVFQNGSYWIDQSHDKDGSLLSILCEYKDLNIVGNIYANSDLI